MLTFKKCDVSTIWGLLTSYSVGFTTLRSYI